jgi:hypothetical protein
MNPDYISRLASNPVFIHAIAVQILSSTNNEGIAIKQSQTLTFPTIKAVTFASNAAKITMSATSSAELTPVIFNSANSTVATVKGNLITILGAGSTTITASQAGNALWNPVSASQTFVVLPITQTLSFPAIPVQKSVAGQKVPLKASSSANLFPITYSVANTSIASVSNNILTILGTGSTTVTATQAGNQNYTPATASQQLIVK